MTHIMTQILVTYLDSTKKTESFFAILTRELTEKEKEEATEAASFAERILGISWEEGLKKYLDDLNVLAPRYVITRDTSRNVDGSSHFQISEYTW